MQVKTCLQAIVALAVLATSQPVCGDESLLAGLEAQEREDYATALNLLLPLAENGNPTAQNAIGTLYYAGNGVDQDHQAAVEWFRMAADQGNPQAQKNLGTAYFAGLGVPQDDEQGVFWMRKAAD